MTHVSQPVCVTESGMICVLLDTTRCLRASPATTSCTPLLVHRLAGASKHKTFSHTLGAVMAKVARVKGGQSTIHTCF